MHTQQEDTSVRPVAIIGGGTLGRRVALMFATRGGEVRIYDPIERTRAEAVTFAQDLLPEVVATISDGRPGNIRGADDLSEALADAWLVIEAIPERLDQKVDLFSELDRLASPDAILATNSSSFPSHELISGVERPERVVNMHFFMPPAQRAVELMSCGFTTPAIIDRLVEVLPQFGIVPFVARAESMGFIFNRVWAAIKREVLEVVAAGVATPEEVDALWMLNTGFPAGVFQSMDTVGLDVVLDIENSYAARYPTLSPAPRELLHRYVDAGHLGVKTGRGFYEYPTADATAPQVSKGTR